MKLRVGAISAATTIILYSSAFVNRKTQDFVFFLKFVTISSVSIPCFVHLVHTVKEAAKILPRFLYRVPKDRLKSGLPSP